MERILFVVITVIGSTNAETECIPGKQFENEANTYTISDINGGYAQAYEPGTNTIY